MTCKKIRMSRDHTLTIWSAREHLRRVVQFFVLGSCNFEPCLYYSYRVSMWPLCSCHHEVWSKIHAGAADLGPVPCLYKCKLDGYVLNNKSIRMWLHQDVRLTGWSCPCWIICAWDCLSETELPRVKLVRSAFGIWLGVPASFPVMYVEGDRSVNSVRHSQNWLEGLDVQPRVHLATSFYLKLLPLFKTTCFLVCPRAPSVSYLNVIRFWVGEVDSSVWIRFLTLLLNMSPGNSDFPAS